MANLIGDVDPIYAEFLARYEKWRAIYGQVGRTARDEVVWQDECLHLRQGYPYEGWTAYILCRATEGFNVLTATTERRNEPLEGVAGFFSDADDAGKYIIWNVGESLRVNCRVDPVEWIWDDLGLDSRVEQISLGQYESKYVLKSDPTHYFVLKAGGVQPENRLLPLTYDELDELLVADLPLL